MKNVIIAVLAVGLIVLAVFCYKQSLSFRAVGKDGKKNNLADVDCKTHGASGNGNAGKAEIDVNSTDPVAIADEGVFVCTGEKVFWQAGPHVTSIDVSFAKTDWPFDPSSYTATLHASAGGSTTEQVVASLPPGPPNYRMKPSKYTIVVKTDSGATLNLDPHIIPMGP